MKEIFSIFLMGALFILTDCLALLITRPLKAAGVSVFDNPDDPMNVVNFFLIMLVFTVVILLIAKYWKKQVVHGIILASMGFTAFYVIFSLLVIVLPELWSLYTSLGAVAILVAILIKFPEWYVMDAIGIMVAVGVMGMLGISLNIFLVIVLLVTLSLYDAISVYKTKHMIDLADTVLTLKLPLILVVPKITKYSLAKETESLKEKLKKDEERDAFFMGLGDIIMPGILAISAFHNISDNGLLVALSVVFGTIFGFFLLTRAVLQGKPQAGLPYLCSGAILGYLISSYVLFGEVVGLF